MIDSAPTLRSGIDQLRSVSSRVLPCRWPGVSAGQLLMRSRIARACAFLALVGASGTQMAAGTAARAGATVRLRAEPMFCGTATLRLTAGTGLRET